MVKDIAPERPVDATNPLVQSWGDDYGDFSSHIILRYHQAPPVALCDPVLPRLDASGTSSFHLVIVQQRMSPLRCNNAQSAVYSHGTLARSP